MKPFFLAFVLVLSFQGLSAHAQHVEAFFQRTDAFLKSAVNREGLVRYAAIHQQPDALQALVRELAQFPLERLQSRAGQKAFWINAYNLLVIHGVVQFYPIQSPKDVPGFFNKRKHRVAGRLLTLDQIEHDILRKQYPDPRLHFVLVCAAKSCPYLIPEAFVPDRLEAQLEKRARAILNDARYVRVDTGRKTVFVSEIFKWYESDFLQQARSIIEYLNQYRTTPVPSGYAVRFIPYDWSLNEAPVPKVNHGMGRSLQNFTPSTMLQRGEMEIKLFNNLYTQTAYFDDRGTRRDQGGRSTYFTGIVYFLTGFSTRINAGIDVYFKSVRNGPAGSSPLSVFQFASGADARTAVALIAPKLKLVPFPAFTRLAMQIQLLIPAAQDLQGLRGERPFLEYDDIQWWTQFFYDYRFTPEVYLYLENGLYLRFDRKDPALLTPIKAIFNYLPTPRWTLHFQGELAPTWEGLGWSNYYSQLGAGVKFFLRPNFELESLVTVFPFGKNGGAGQTYNFGIRWVR